MDKAERIENFARDLYDRSGAFVTANQLRQYLGCGRNTAERMLKGLTPVCNTSYRKYYYREVAEVLARGV